MPFFYKIAEIFIHLDQHLDEILAIHDVTVYIILFSIIFLETAFLLASFLPGDLLLFSAGTFASSGSLDIVLLFIIFISAAILGNTVNYFLGKWLGPWLFHQEKNRFFNKKKIEDAHRFYENYGGITLVIACFLPFFRTFAPFIAGIGKMTFKKFMFYNVLGSVTWITCFTLTGYFFGKLPVVKNNSVLSLLVASLLMIIIMPLLIYIIKKNIKPKKGI
jgi:membrane-associated protein